LVEESAPVLEELPADVDSVGLLSISPDFSLFFDPLALLIPEGERWSVE